MENATSYPTSAPILAPSFSWAPTPLPTSHGFQCSSTITLNDVSQDDAGSQNDDAAVDRGEWPAIGQTVVLYVVIGSILLAIFEACRSKRSVYFPRTSRLRHRAPPPPGRWPLAWLRPVLLIEDDEVLRMVGLDGWICIAYLRWCAKACLFCSFWSCTVLMPFYTTGVRQLEDSFRQITMDNLQSGSWRLWSSCIFSCIYTLYALYTLDKEWRAFVGHRNAFLDAGDPDSKGGNQLAYSVRLESLPAELRSDLALRAYMERLFPGKIHSVVVNVNLGPLQTLIDRRQRACENLEAAIAHRSYNRRRRLGDSASVNAHNYGDANSGRGLDHIVSAADVIGGKDLTKGSPFDFEGDDLNSPLIDENMAGADRRDHSARDGKASEGNRWRDTDEGFLPEDEPREWLFCTRVPGCDGGSNGTGFDFDAESADAMMDGSRGVIDDDDGISSNNDQCHGIVHSVRAVRYHRRRLDALNKEVAEMQDSVSSRSSAIESTLEASMRKQFKSVLEIQSQFTSAIGARMGTGLSASTHPKPPRDGVKGDSGASAGAASLPLESNNSAQEPPVSNSAPQANSEKSIRTMGSEAAALTRETLSSATTTVADSATGLVSLGAQELASNFGLMADGARLGLTGVAQGLKILTLGEGKSSSAYVTFKSKVAVTDCRQVLLGKEAFKINVHTAPDPRDLIWENASVTETEGNTRNFVVSIVLGVFGPILFIAALTFLAGLKNLSSIDQLDGLKWLQRYTSTDDDKYSETSIEYVFVTEQLPVLLQVGLVALLPVILTAITHLYERAKSQSEVQRRVLSRYFGFQLVQIYATLVSGSLTSTLNAVLQEPTCIFFFLGSAIPGVAVYFSQLIIIKTLLGLPLELSRVWPLIRLTWFQYFQLDIASSRFARQVKDDTATFDEGSIYPNFLLVITVCFAYATIVPFICVIGFGYFVMAYCVYKHQLLFVFIPKFETGGTFFTTLMGYTLTGINFANITFVGYLGIKNGWSQAALVFCLLPLVEGYRYYAEKAYGARVAVLSREAAVEIDQRYVAPSLPLEAGTGGGGDPDSEDVVPPWVAFDEKLYRQPALDTEPLKPMRPAREHQWNRRPEASQRRNPVLGSGAASSERSPESMVNSDE